jgi:hypothetical protein
VATAARVRATLLQYAMFQHISRKMFDENFSTKIRLVARECKTRAEYGGDTGVAIARFYRA